MLVLMYLAAAAVYLIVMVLVVGWAWRAGRADGGSRLKGFGFAFAGFLVVYLPMFWNHVPVLIVQRARCAKDAGFTVLVTAKQWVEKNKATVEQLRGADLNKSAPSRKLSSGFSRSEYFGGALANETRDDSERKFGMRFSRHESRVLDARTGELLTLDVSYGVGPRDDARFWLVGHECPKEEPGAMLPLVRYHVELKEQMK